MVREAQAVCCLEKTPLDLRQEMAILAHSGEISHPFPVSTNKPSRAAFPCPHRMCRLDQRGPLCVADCGGAGVPAVLQRQRIERRTVLLRCEIARDLLPPREGLRSLGSRGGVSELSEVPGEAARSGHGERSRLVEAAAAGGGHGSGMGGRRASRRPALDRIGTRDCGPVDAAAAHPLLHMAGMIPRAAR